MFFMPALNARTPFSRVGFSWISISIISSMLQANNEPKKASRSAHPNNRKLTMMTASDSSSPRCGLTIDEAKRIAKMTLRTSFSTKSTNGNGLISASTSKQWPSNHTTPATATPTTV
jgi:hypothetical protein